jgi:gamma-butyrobetaine dioxygenase
MTEEKDLPEMELKDAGGGDFLDLLQDIFENEGASEYLGEAVSMAEHMIQTAVNAERNGAEEALIVACLLHDIGHFAQVKAARSDWHRRHDEAVAAFLDGHFGPEVVEPARLHVAAKRYLCAVEPDYYDRLSPASRHTLERQGGPMTAEEVRAFESNPYHEAACRLRRWEEAGKTPGVESPDFADFRPLLARLRLDP